MLLAGLVAGLMASGCTPQCERVCRKATECGLTARLNQLECEESCIRQRDLYEDWEDEDKIEDFAAHRRCIIQATCEELEDGVCYDEDLYVF